MNTPRKVNINDAQRRLTTALNNIAYAHVNKYAKALGNQAKAQSNAARAAAAAAANPNAGTAARAAAAAAAAAAAGQQVAQVGEEAAGVLGAVGSSAANLSGQGGPAAEAAANNTEANVAALIARIMAGNFTRNGVFNQKMLNINNQGKIYKNRNNVKRAIANKYSSPVTYSAEPGN
jgi:hypothetical protein